MSDLMMIDSLAHEIRRVDGRNSLGAAALAEALMPFIHTELEALRKDAERYRWLRHGDNDEACIRYTPHVHGEATEAWLLRNEELDAAIDSLSGGDA